MAMHSFVMTTLEAEIFHVLWFMIFVILVLFLDKLEQSLNKGSHTFSLSRI